MQLSHEGWPAPPDTGACVVQIYATESHCRSLSEGQKRQQYAHVAMLGTASTLAGLAGIQGPSHWQEQEAYLDGCICSAQWKRRLESAEPHLRNVGQALRGGERAVDEGQRLEGIAGLIHRRLHAHELVQDAQGHLRRLHAAHAACSARNPLS